MNGLTRPACMARAGFLVSSNNDVLKPGDA